MSDAATPPDSIRVRGARVHNLQSVDVDFPHGRLIVVSGPSGSGKSSLVFDTVFAEGRRQYLETLSLRARQVFRQLERPDVDLIENVQPTICIDQFPVARNPRGTVATLTEFHDYLRVLFARLGTPTCLTCSTRITRYGLEEIQAELMGLPAETRVMLLAPFAREESGSHDGLFADFRRRGFLRVRVDGEILELDEVVPLDPSAPHTIELVVDRLIVRPGVEKRFADSLRLAADNPFDQVVALVRGRFDTDFTEHRFSTRYACPNCGFSLPLIQPRHFNPASPVGACPTCQGIGEMASFVEEEILARPDSPLNDQPFAKVAPELVEQSVAFLRKLHVDGDAPLASLDKATRRKLWEGCGRPRFDGLHVLLQHKLATSTNRADVRQLEALQSTVRCHDCGGHRLGAVGRSVKLEGKTIGDVVQLTVADAADWLAGLQLSEDSRPIWEPLVQPLKDRLEFLTRVGVDYLTLDRRADTLSGGELQRIRLANAIGRSLAGVCYVLDEPSIGLHPRDNARLVDAIKRLRDAGNTVIVVEHDLSMIRAADVLIDMGPSAGPMGGHVLAMGSVEEVAATDSPTASYLRGATTSLARARRRNVQPERGIRIEGVRTHNLQDVDVAIPLHALVCVTGVSGSGKSSLVHATLAPAIRHHLGSGVPISGSYRHLHGADQIRQLISVDQSPIGRTPRSNPATYTGVFDEIRKIFAKTRGAKQRGFNAQRFSFNAKSGRCEACRGYGVKKIEMGVLADLTVTCDRCAGRRFNPQTLQVRFRHKSIADVLDMSIDEAVEFFAAFERIHRPLSCLAEVGLGYVRLGQPADTLSGGEAQRVKLATELARPARGASLYLLDEPTTGLHLRDIERLVAAFHRLIDAGNTVLVIEHQLDVIHSADWIIDMGPGAGNAGGKVVAVGPPEAIADCPESHTGRYLREEFQMVKPMDPPVVPR